MEAEFEIPAPRCSVRHLLVYIYPLLAPELSRTLVRCSLAMQLSHADHAVAHFLVFGRHPDCHDFESASRGGRELHTALLICVSSWWV